MESKLHSQSVIRASLMLGVASVSFLCAPAYAQDVPPPENRGEMGTSTPAPGLEEIVVTARKREETTQDVPVAITAISEETIQKYNLNTLESVAASTPQFTVGRAGSGSGATLVLRGIGSNTTSIGLEQSVAVVVDSVYYGQGRTINEGFFDLGQIEILKGPQALFFGKNATAGVISMATKNPGDELELIGRVGYEFNAEEIQTELIASGPISDTFGARLAVSYEKQFGTLFPNFAQPETWRLTDIATGTTRFLEGVEPNDEPGTTNLIARLTLAWDPIDQLSINLKGSMTDAKSDDPLLNYVPYFCPSGSSALNPQIPCGKQFKSYGGASPEEVSQDIPWGRDDGQPFNDYRSYSITGTINYDLGNILITNVANYHWNRNKFGLDGNIVWSAPVGVFGTENTTWESFSNELRATSDLGGVFDFMIGGLYQSSKRDYRNATAQAGLENSAAPDGFRFVGNSKDSETDGETLAIFTQAIFRPLPQVEVAGGVRYTHETKDSFFVQPYSNPALAAVFSPGVRITADQTFENYSPEITVSYQPSD